MNTAVIHSLADWPLIFLTLRIVLTTLFWSDVFLGIAKFNDFAGAVQRAGLPYPRFVAAAAIVFLSVTSLLVITNFNQWGWIAASALVVFTLLTIPYGHAFWTFPQPRRAQELHFVLEHISVVGGLLLLIAVFLSNAGVSPV
ncbi:DoxX family protein [Rhizobium sp. BR 314]|uniref:DoxX family protein n=1 Tax=Rhizobium sp. BR 314 TaxID=3040013 RepID=UPI0039BED5DB